MGRSNPLGLRVGSLIDWPSNVRHPLLASYIKHIFQGHIVGEPGIRASTTGIWINVAVYPESVEKLQSHPRFKDPCLEFRSVNLTRALGRTELRISQISKGKNPYLRSLFDGLEKKPIEKLKKSGTETVTFEGIGPLVARENEVGTLAAMRIYRDTPIHLRFNVLSTPIMSADVMAQHVAKQLASNRSLPMIYKSMLRSIG